MNKFVTGLLIGVGIGWLTASSRGKEVRRIVGELSDNTGVNRYIQGVSDSLAQIGSNRGELLQLITSMLPKDYESTLNELAKTAASKMGDRKFTVSDLSRLADWLVRQVGQLRERVS